MGGIISSGPYDYNPFVGNRPMKYPYTIAAKFAQFPWVYHYKYTIWFKPMLIALIPQFYVMYKIQRWSFSPSNVELWKQKRKEWYSRHYSPEYDCY